MYGDHNTIFALEKWHAPARPLLLVAERDGRRLIHPVIDEAHAETCKPILERMLIDQCSPRC